MTHQNLPVNAFENGGWSMVSETMQEPLQSCCFATVEVATMLAITSLKKKFKNYLISSWVLKFELLTTHHTHPSITR